MNTKLLGAIFVALAALIGSPILAEAVTDLDGVRVQMDDDGFNTIVFKTQDVVPTDGSFNGGYAIPTSGGDYIVVTSHEDFVDSEIQFDRGFETWHTHLVKASENDRCDGLAIEAVSYEEPSASVLVRDTNILVRTIATGPVTYHDIFDSHRDREFTVGNPIYLERQPDNETVSVSGDERPGVRANGIVESIAFDFNVAADRTWCLGEVNE